jgi:hypothetical protein
MAVQARPCLKQPIRSLRVHSLQSRSSKDRRNASTNARFPLRDSDGVLIAHERRIRPDRRLAAGLEMEWREMKVAGEAPK